MTYFTENDTEGFTSDELEVLNTALDIVLRALSEDVDVRVHTCVDAVCDEWNENIDTDELARRAIRLLEQ